MDSKTWTGPNRRIERINDVRVDRVYRAYRLLETYANPLRIGMPLSQTEDAAVEDAVSIMRGRR